MENGAVNRTELSLTYLAHTEKAVLVTEGAEDGEGKVASHWIPFSQCNFADLDETRLRRGDNINLEVSEWLAKERGLI